MKILFRLFVMFFVAAAFQNCQKSPVDNSEAIPEQEPSLLKIGEINSEIPAAMDTVQGSNPQTRTGGAYVAIVRDIIFTNPFIGVPLLSTLSAPLQHPEPGIWIREKQIIQATHTLKAEWDGSDGYNWTYLWNGGAFDNFMALDGHTDVPGLNGNYTMYYNDNDHSIYGTKTWSVDAELTLTAEWVREAYTPLNVPERIFLSHFHSDGSGDLTFWEDSVKRFYIEWNGDGSGSWDLWGDNGNTLHGTFSG